MNILNNLNNLNNLKILNIFIKHWNRRILKSSSITEMKKKIISIYIFCLFSRIKLSCIFFCRILIQCILFDIWQNIYVFEYIYYILCIYYILFPYFYYIFFWYYYTMYIKFFLTPLHNSILNYIMIVKNLFFL